MRNSIIYIILIESLFFSSCTGYEKLLKSSDYEMKYNKADEYYQEENYTKAYTLFEQCLTVYTGTAKADTINYYLAMSYYNLGDYTTAGYYFRNFSNNYSRSPFAEECDYMGAYCYYLQSPRISLDQSNTYLALEALNTFVLKHPYNKRVTTCKSLIDELKDKLVEKSFTSSKLYYDLGYYKSAIISLRNSLNNYPDTKHREEIMYLILKSRYFLALNSVEKKKKERLQATIDEYYSFIAEFPKSGYIKDSQKIYKDTNKMLIN